LKLERGSQIRICCHSAGQPPRQIWVKVLATIAGGDLIAVDKQGQLYTTFWQTESKRPAGKPTISKRHWRKYSQGLYSLKRALLYALFEAEEIKIPTLAELQEFCQNKRAQISVLANGIKELQSIALEFTALQGYLANKKRWPLKESRGQLRFFLLLRDSLGRINIGVLQARLSAINSRFTAELEHLLGWTPHYAARLSSVTALQRQFERGITDISRQLGGLLVHQGFKTGKTSDPQVVLMRDLLRRQIALLNGLRQIQPFTKWADYCLADLAWAHNLLEQKQFDLAQVVIKRLTQAMRLRLLGFQLEEVLAEFSFDLLFGRVDQKQYCRRISCLYSQLQKVDETGFAKPVCQLQILPALKKAMAALADRQYLKTKSLLKSAVSLI